VSNPSAALLAASALGAWALYACAVPRGVSPDDVAFDTATVWVRQGTDSARLVVEVAASREQQEAGLAGRASLDPGSGMLFLFGSPRSAEEGFWMWRTNVPLDIAFIDADGVIQGILSMEPCRAAFQDDCPGYFPDSPYVAALEVSRGWFERNGIEVGTLVRWEMSS
jgi:uncharacterized membrane protein (UPF0127 family)